MTMDNNAIIQIRELTKSFPMGKSEFTALRDINLTIGRGEFTGLIGPSGSGKTTLLNIVGSLDTPTSGEAWVLNKSIGGLSAKEAARLRKEKLGFIFQSYNLLAVHTVFENVERSFTEYLSPPREEGTKMLKLEEQLWIYSPSTDRTIQISGHMLRQSVMGSDHSYEDMMDDRKLTETYNAVVIDSEVLDDRKTWILELTAKEESLAYASRKIWVDTERYVPLKEELYAKSGKLLKRAVMSDVV